MRLSTAVIAGAALAVGAPACAQSADLAQKLERRASAGNFEARYHLGMLYNNGIGVTRDVRRAFEHFRAAAEGGDPLGAYKLGCYYAGQFGSEAVAPDEAQALRWKLAAARAGYALAQLDVAIHFARRDQWAEARGWFEQAARQGDAQSLYHLFYIHNEGLGIARSLPHSWAYFRLSQLAGRGEINSSAERALTEWWEEMDVAGRAEAESIAASFVTGPTELTRRALRGLQRAEEVAAGQ